jgi:hypothetical protein
MLERHHGGGLTRRAVVARPPPIGEISGDDVCRHITWTEVAVRTKWVVVSVICLLSARPSAAGEPPHAVTALFERAARPAALKGIGEASSTDALDARDEPRRVLDAVAVFAQPANSAPASRSWFLRHSVLVGVVAGAAVGVGCHGWRQQVVLPGQ